MKSKNYPSISGFGFAYSKVKKREKRDREIGGKGEGGKEEERLHTGCQKTLFNSDCAAELQNIPEQDSQPLRPHLLISQAKLIRTIHLPHLKTRVHTN